MDKMAALMEKNLRLLLENAEELTDEELEEEALEEYRAVQGASEAALEAFEARFQIRLPEDFKALYRYKDGSGFLPLIWPQEEYYHGYRLLSLEEIGRVKGYFQHEDREMAEYPDCFDAAALGRLDRRIKPHLFCRRWIPFAEYAGALYLMLDYDPSEAGTVGQVICYIHDPDFVHYVAPSVACALERTEAVIEGLV